MRICVLTTSYPRSADDDAGIFIKRLVDAYAHSGAAGLVVVPHDRDEPLQAREGSFEIERFRYGVFSRGRLAFGAGGLPNLRANPLLILQAPMLVLQTLYRAVARRDSYDVLHANWSVAAVVAWAASLITGKPYLVSIRGEDLRFSRPRLQRRLLTLPLRRAFRVVSVNESFLDELRTRFSLPPDRVACIPNGVEVALPSPEQLAAFCRSRGLPAGKYLLFVGTIIPRKRITLLIDLLSEPALRGYTLILCGRVDNQEYVTQVLAQAQAKGVHNRVIVTGKVPPAEVPYFLALARCYVSASEFEGRSNSVLEACAARLPVCLSDIAAHRELISAEHGFLFNAQNLGEAARFIARVDTDAFYRLQITEAALAVVRELTWERCAAKYLELCRAAV